MMLDEETVESSPSKAVLGRDSSEESSIVSRELAPSTPATPVLDLGRGGASNFSEEQKGAVVADSSEDASSTESLRANAASLSDSLSGEGSDRHSQDLASQQRRPSLLESLNGIVTYAISSIAPFHEEHPKHGESLHVAQEIGFHVENVFTTISQTIAPLPQEVENLKDQEGRHTSESQVPKGQSLSFSSDAETSATGHNLLTYENENDPSLILQRKVIDALVDTCNQDVAYAAAQAEAVDFVRGFFKLLAKDHSKYKPTDWEKLGAMLSVDPDLMWKRVIRKLESTHQKFEETFSPLHCAAAVGHKKLCERLLQFPGADVEIVDKYGRQALHIAAYHGHADICTLLTQKILEVTGKNPVGENAPVDLIGWTPAAFSMRGRRSRELAVHDRKTHGTEDEIRKQVEEAVLQREELKRSGKTTRLVRNKIQDLEKTLLTAKFGRCKDLLYAHGDHHISPKSEHQNRASEAAVALRSSPFSPFSPQRKRLYQRHSHASVKNTAAAIAGAALVSSTGRVSDSPLRTKLRSGFPLEVPPKQKSPMDESNLGQTKNTASKFEPNGLNIPVVSSETGILNVLERNEQEEMAEHAIAKSRLVVACGHYHMTGMRLTNEDEILIAVDDSDDAWGLFAVFDGHGGDFTSGYLRREFAKRFRNTIKENGGGISADEIKSALHSVALSVNDSLSNHPRMKNYYSKSSESKEGATSAKSSDSTFSSTKVTGADSKPCDGSGAVGVIAVVTLTHIVVANVGDARCLLQKRGVAAEEATTLTQDHDGRNEVERNRIIEAGGYVHPDTFNIHLKEGSKEYRQPTRAWGDFKFSSVGITCEPEFTVVKRGAEGGELLVLGCDGVFEGKGMDTGAILNQVASSAPMLALVRSEISPSMPAQTSEVTSEPVNCSSRKYSTPVKTSAMSAVSKNGLGSLKSSLAVELTKACEDVLLLGIDSGTTDNQSVCVVLLGSANLQSV